MGASTDVKAKTRMAAKITNTAIIFSHFSSHFSSWTQENCPKMASQEESGSRATTNFKNLNFGKSLYQHYLGAELYAILRIIATIEAIWVLINTHATKVMARVYQATMGYYN